MMAPAVLRTDPCSYCQENSGTVDHIEPRANGGRDVPNNRAGACPHCNKLKSETPLLLFLVRRRYPVRTHPFDRYSLSCTRRKKIRRAFRRLDAIERHTKKLEEIQWTNTNRPAAPHG